MDRPPFPEVITNSARSNFAICPRKFELSDVFHWKPKSTSIHLHAGGAFAKGIEVARKAYYVEGCDQDTAIARGWEALVAFYKTEYFSDDETKSVERMAGALTYYFEVWPFAQDFLEPYTTPSGQRTIEFSFTVPLPIAHPVTGNPILYYGRFDMVGQHKNGEVYVVDEKTASQLGNAWVDQWKLDAQFTGYCWGARQFGIPVGGAIIRGISILKTQYGHAQSIQQRPDWMIDAWYNQLLRDIHRMIQLWQDGYFDRSYGPGCKMYGKCQFTDICSSLNPDRWLEADFVQRPHEPWKEQS
jgi:hypothetical protein